jgi:hypothetical protein
VRLVAGGFLMAGAALFFGVSFNAAMATMWVVLAVSFKNKRLVESIFDWPCEYPVTSAVTLIR